MIDQAKLRALVARELCDLHQEGYSNAEDGRSLSAAPYVKFGSPMGSYQAMGRLLSNADEKFLGLSFFAAIGRRREQRRMFLGYVADLRTEARELLGELVKTGGGDREDAQRRWNIIQAALRSLTLSAWMHSVYMPGIPARVRRALREISGALDLGQLVQMPQPLGL